MCFLLCIVNVLFCNNNENEDDDDNINEVDGANFARIFSVLGGTLADLDSTRYRSSL